MNVEKQKLLISYLLSSNDLFTKTNSIVETNYFDPEVRHAVYFIKDYFDKYKTAPNPDQVKAETGLFFDQKQLTRDEIEYATNEMETYCRHKAIEAAALAMPKLIQKGDFGSIEKRIRDALSVSLQKNLGLDYFADPETRIKNMLLNNSMIPTGWAELDANLNGGVSRKEMTIFMANSGVGKSLLMSNAAVNFLEQQLNVSYITLELAEPVVAKRFDSMISGISQTEIFTRIPKVSAEIESKSHSMGKLFIKRMPESTTRANDIRAYLKEFEIINGFIPDVIIVDYMDLMTTNNKISAENLFIKDKFVAEELRAIANDYDCVMITASQMGRSALESNEHHQGHIQGGISKVNTTDNLIAIIQTDQMKAAGEYILKLIKTRSSGGVGKSVVLKWNEVSLRVTNLNDLAGKKANLQKDEEPSKPVKKDLLSLIDV